MPFVIDLKNRTVAKFTKNELMTFANTVNYKKKDFNSFWVIETRDRAVKVIKNLIKRGY